MDFGKLTNPFEAPPSKDEVALAIAGKRYRFWDDIEIYLSALSREIALYAGREGLKGRQFEFVYFGGGTPSYLSNEQLHRLIDRINENWRWDAAKEVTFECEPGTLKQSKLETIRQIGTTRLSLGVEHFDDEILSSNGRAHKSPEIAKALSENLNRAVAASTTNSYDTHPSLQERMLALQKWSQDISEESSEAALSLLENAQAVEERLMRSIVKLNPGQELKPIHWDEAGSKVWLPLWEAQVKPYVAQLSGFTVQKLPGLCRNPALFSPRVNHLGNELSPETRRHVGILTLGSALTLALHVIDWKLRVSPGTPVSLEHSGATVKPFVSVRDLSIGLITEESWRFLVTSCGIGDLPLATQR